MDAFNEFINQLPDYLGVFLLMFSAFLIGYFSAWALQRSKYTKMLKKVKRQANLTKLNTPSSSISDIDTIFTEIKPKIVEVVKQTQQESIDKRKEEIATKTAEEIVEKARTSYITYSKNKPELNFENFGYGSKEDKDDLTQINGIGPYIEQRLNEIGIYNFDQISRFHEEDIRILTELIDFFPGRIERDNWVAQAASLKTY